MSEQVGNLDKLSLTSPKIRSPLARMNIQANANEVLGVRRLKPSSSHISDLIHKPILHALATVSEGQEHTESFSSENQDENATPKRALVGAESFKRPSPLTDEFSHRITKRAKSTFVDTKNIWNEDEDSDTSLLENSFGSSVHSPGQLSSKKLNRSHSDSAITIKSAVERIGSDPKLVGDGSAWYVLPTLEDGNGKHIDLKEISPSILIGLLNGQYYNKVDSFEVVDCRYPYEYNGGHIKGAINLHTKRQVFERYIASKTALTIASAGKRREIIIFHCEFSSQRGPDMCRYLRECDRKMNEYPSLHYPELYVLHGGYKAFFEQYKQHCEPQVYLPMVHEKYTEEFRMYKSLSKTDVVNPKKPNSKTKFKSMRHTSTRKLNLDD